MYQSILPVTVKKYLRIEIVVGLFIIVKSA
jgi:hypothetical protein